MQQVSGLLGQRAEDWRGRVIQACALIEAGIDFSDEADVPQDMATRALAIVGPLAVEVAQALSSARRGERLRDGLWVVIAGPPNAGKSTLLNRLAQREAAIVSPFAGTTRDVIEVHLDLAGYPVNLLDTAGIRASSKDPIEREGMQRARAAAERANLVLWVVDASSGEDGMAVGLQDGALASGTSRWLVVNKIDLVDPGRRDAIADQCPAAHCISATSGEGLDRLTSAIVQYAEECFTREPALVTRERQRVALEAVLRTLESAARHAEARAGEELVAEELRQAATHLGRLTGRVDVEDVLEVIFREFCIGK